MKRCTRCLYPASKPDLHFDADGICSACRAYDKRKTIDWAAREKELLRLLDEHDGRCIVASSGGKDSTWQVLKLLELGARPLVVTATTCHLTEIGRANIDNLARYATTIEVTPNRTVRAKLNRIGLELVGDISWPEHVSIFTTPFRVACDMRIPLIFYGECPQEAYGGPPGSEQAKAMTLRWVQEFGGLNGLRPSDLIGREGITREDMADYLAPPSGRIAEVGVAAYWLGQFCEWDSHRNARVATEHGMQKVIPSAANWWDFENLDCAFTGIHDYCMACKYGYNRATAQLSVDIRAGLISREDAARKNAKRNVFPDPYMGIGLDEILGRIGMTRPDFWSVCERYTSKRLHGDTEDSRHSDAAAA